MRRTPLDLAHMFEHEYTNVKQFASGIKDGAETYIVTTLLAIQEHPAPECSCDSAHSLHSLDPDPVVICKIDAAIALNVISQ